MAVLILFHITLPLFSFPLAVTAEHVGWVKREEACQVCRNCLQTHNRSHRPSWQIPSMCCTDCLTRGSTGRFFHSVIIYIYAAFAAELGLAHVGGDFGWLEPKGN